MSKKVRKEKEKTVTPIRFEIILSATPIQLDNPKSTFANHGKNMEERVGSKGR